MLRILIVGNKRSSLTLIDTLLYLIPGVTVITALSALEAVELLCLDKKIDLIFVDSDAPEIEAHQAFSHIRRIRPHIPTIIMSQSSLKIDFQSFFRKGVTQYLSSPYNSQSLLEKIEGIMNIRVFDDIPASLELQPALLSPRAARGR